MKYTLGEEGIKFLEENLIGGGTRKECMANNYKRNE